MALALPRGRLSLSMTKRTQQDKNTLSSDESKSTPGKNVLFLDSLLWRDLIGSVKKLQNPLGLTKKPNSF